jgi:hypothetical protein
MRDELANKKNKLGDSHPDVIRITKEVDLLAEEVDQNGNGQCDDNPPFR